MSSTIASPWGANQERERQEYLEHYQATGDYFGYFSVPRFGVTFEIAKTIGALKGPVLDIGCGILPTPNYLVLCNDVVGIDPYYGEHKRSFPFVQAIGEQLPFKSKSFNAALIMSVLDHSINPEYVLAESWRVLTRGSKLLVWYISRDKLPDRHHRWSFTTDKLCKWLVDVGFEFVKLISYPGDREVGYPATQMITARKETK